MWPIITDNARKFHPFCDTLFQVFFPGKRVVVRVMGGCVIPVVLGVDADVVAVNGGIDIPHWHPSALKPQEGRRDASRRRKN